MKYFRYPVVGLVAFIVGVAISLLQLTILLLRRGTMISTITGAPHDRWVDEIVISEPASGERKSIVRLK